MVRLATAAFPTPRGHTENGAKIVDFKNWLGSIYAQSAQPLTEQAEG
jgi:hypothetical protein